MFRFKRENTEYNIIYLNQGDDDLLVCTYEESGSTKWRSAADTYELIHKNGTFYNDEEAFLDFFLGNLNSSLDKAHSSGDSDGEPQERLTALIINSLSFDGKHVVR